MPVFISYQRADETKAVSIKAKFDSAAVPSYLDLLDPSLVETVTQNILNALHKCTHMMAVVSTNTVNSWWVPFEIGVATERESRITSYRRDSVTLPDYLKKWPVLDYDSQLDDFIQLYKKDKEVLEMRKSYSEAASTSIRKAADFHAQLKARLGQR